MLECDYLIVGAGASGMAFADAIVSESTDRTAILIDKLPEPGGHWNHAYDFVRLHQAACFYGVASEKLERDGETALHLYQDLSSKREILDYYRRVLDKLVATRRVRHFGECTYHHKAGGEDDGNASETSIDERPFVLHSFTDKEGISQTVKVKRRLVDATYLNIQVPSTHPPRYDVQAGVECIPINGIHGMAASTSHGERKKFVLVGSGKTGIDAALYLLDVVGVDPADITWIMPRDAWLFDRAFFDPKTLLLKASAWFNDEPTHEKSLLRQEASGFLLRLDAAAWPEKYSCATVERDELAKLRAIKNVIRRGRVAAITKDHLIMEGEPGERIPYETGSIFVDCSACGLPPRPAVPIFQPFRIVLQPVMMCMICISAAAAGYVECHAKFEDDGDRNRLMVPVPYPNTTDDSVGIRLGEMHNQLLGVGSDPRTESWYNSCRLNVTSHSSNGTLLRMFAGGIFGGGFYGMMRSFRKGADAAKAQYRQIHQEDFALEVYTPRQMKRATRQMLAMTMFFYAVALGGLAALAFLFSLAKGAWLSGDS